MYYWRKMKSILSMLLLALSCCAVAQIPENALWVDASSPNTGNGSKSSPYKTIARAVRSSKPGATIVVKNGIYREDVSIGKSITLMGMPGERAVVSGMRKISGWKPVGKGIYKTAVDWNPLKLFVGFTEQPMARLPKEGWWKVSKKAKDCFKSDKLKTVPDKLNGVQSYIWIQKRDIFFTLDINSIDKSDGSAKFTIPNKWFTLKDGDNIFLKNHRSLISLPGEWSVEKSGNKFNIYFMPENEGDLIYQRLRVSFPLLFFLK